MWTDMAADTKRWEVTDRNYNHLAYVYAVNAIGALMEAGRMYKWTGSAAPRLRVTEVGR